MTFLAIVHAPMLRPGARVCISDLEQKLGRSPGRIAPGVELAVRFGTCCPDLARGTIGLCDTGTDEAVLRTAGVDWRIRRARGGGVAIPGLVAEDWFVVDAGAA